jgi:hypothetical protein
MVYLPHVTRWTQANTAATCCRRAAYLCYQLFQTPTLNSHLRWQLKTGSTLDIQQGSTSQTTLTLSAL